MGRWAAAREGSSSSQLPLSPLPRSPSTPPPSSPPTTPARPKLRFRTPGQPLLTSGGWCRSALTSLGYQQTLSGHVPPEGRWDPSWGLLGRCPAGSTWLDLGGPGQVGTWLTQSGQQVAEEAVEPLTPPLPPRPAPVPPRSRPQTAGSGNAGQMSGRAAGPQLRRGGRCRYPSCRESPLERGAAPGEDCSHALRWPQLLLRFTHQKTEGQGHSTRKCQSWVRSGFCS